MEEPGATAGADRRDVFFSDFLVLEDDEDLEAAFFWADRVDAAAAAFFRTVVREDCADFFVLFEDLAAFLAEVLAAEDAVCLDDPEDFVVGAAAWAFAFLAGALASEDEEDLAAFVVEAAYPDSAAGLGATDARNTSAQVGAPSPTRARITRQTTQKTMEFIEDRCVMAVP